MIVATFAEIKNAETIARKVCLADLAIFLYTALLSKRTIVGTTRCRCLVMPGFNLFLYALVFVDLTLSSPLIVQDGYCV
jgi:hypothetical protein